MRNNIEHIMGGVARSAAVAACALCFSCGQKPTENFGASKVEPGSDMNVVVTSKAVSGTFFKEFENNGVLEARQKAELQFEEQGTIVSVSVSNGQWAEAGSVLAKVDDVQQRFTYEKACRSLERCRLTLEETLINQGYSLTDSADVPSAVMQVALIRSGFLDAANEKVLAAHRLRRTQVVAPFAGLVADLKAKARNSTSLYKSFCTFIDNSRYEVAFPMLESEIAQLRLGMSVQMVPFALETDTFAGVLSEINPKVGINGMVDVKALVENRQNKLLEGMNVKVLVRKPLGNKVFVPKEAVTLRQERNVVFVAHNDTAHWRYVEVGETNSLYTVVADGVAPGESVIVEGHFNLAHLSPIQVIKQQ